MKNTIKYLAFVIVLLSGCVKTDMSYMDDMRTPPRRRVPAPRQRVVAPPVRKKAHRQAAPGEAMMPPADNSMEEMKTDEMQKKSSSVKQSSSKFPFYVYKDDKAAVNKFLPTGWMGDIGDIKMKLDRNIDTYSGPTCIEISYTAAKSNGAGWAGVYWQNPANNWGTVDGGYDLTGATKLTFYAKGKEGMEKAEFKIGGIQGKYSDSLTTSSGNLTLTKEWKKYEIDLSKMDLSYVIGGFVWVTSTAGNPDGATIYIDEIAYTAE